MTDSEAPNRTWHDAVAHYVQQARLGDEEEAFHRLRELPPECLDRIADAFRVESEGNVRAVIIAAVREHHDALILPILCEAIDDPSFEVFKEVLDGLVMLASDEVVPVDDVVRVLRENRERTGDQMRQEWIDEAIEQASLPPGSYGF
jgi:hypothetical protein